MMRRTFLKGLGAGATAGPRMMADVAESALGAQRGASLDTTSLHGRWCHTAHDIGQGIPVPPQFQGTTGLRLFHETFGILDYQRAEWAASARRDAKNLGLMDPDLVASRSFSMAGRIGIQRERNLARREATYLESVRTGRIESRLASAMRRIPWLASMALPNGFPED